MRGESWRRERQPSTMNENEANALRIHPFRFHIRLAQTAEAKLSYCGCFIKNCLQRDAAVFLWKMRKRACRENWGYFYWFYNFRPTEKEAHRMPTSRLSAVNKENWKIPASGRRANASRPKCHLVRYVEPVHSDLSRSSIPRLSTVLN